MQTSRVSFRLIIFLTGLFAILCPAPVFAEEETDTSDPLSFNKTVTPLYMYSLDPEAPDYIPGPFWSYGTGKAFTNGNHEVSFSGGLSGLMEPVPYGTAMPSGMFQGSVTYRYKGLFNGIVRPVARFTTGAGQVWLPLGNNSPGMATGAVPYAVSEAGVEIVYKGIGVGMTVGHVWVMDPVTEMQMRDDMRTGLPMGQFDNRGLTWESLLKNVYLIVE